MECRDFLENYSDYLDRTLEVRSLTDYREHLQDCASCARYDRVLHKGLRLVRELPAAESTPDFGARLQHKLFHVREDHGSTQRRAPRVTGVAAAIMAGLLVASTLSLFREGDGQVELPPVVIEAPEQDQAGAVRPASTSRLPGVFTRRPAGPSLLVVPDIAREGWLITPASHRVSLFRAPLTTNRAPLPVVSVAADE